MIQGAFIAFGLGCMALGFTAAWIMRGLEIRKGRERTEFFVGEVNVWKQRAIERLDQMSRWRDRAQTAEAQMAHLPVRLPNGRMAKRS